MKIVDFKNGINAEIPSDWELEENGNLMSLYNPENGVGALQLSFYNVGDASSIDVTKELEKYIEDKHENFIIKTINRHAYGDTEDEDGVYWRYWLFLEKSIVIFVSYNCDESDKGVEDHLVDRILGSIS